jgi:hypothetical protein
LDWTVRKRAHRKGRRKRVMKVVVVMVMMMGGADQAAQAKDCREGVTTEMAVTEVGWKEEDN